MVEAGLVTMERHGHVEDRSTVLDPDYPACGERLAVADAVDVVEDRNLGIAGTQEVRVQRVHGAVIELDGPSRGHQGLAGDLPAEDALAILTGAHAAEDVDFDRLEVE